MSGEWEAERRRGKGIVVCTNGGFPPPVSQNAICDPVLRRSGNEDNSEEG